MGKLQGKVALITGGNSGMGLETAKLFAKEGANVVITGRRKEEVERAAKEIGHGALGVPGDVSKLADLDQLLSKIQSSFGHLDVVFANAGIGELMPITEVNEQHYDKIFDINVKGLVFTIQKALPLMRDGGSIILNASIAGYTGMQAFSVYSASKAAVRSFARSWTMDLRERNIRVNSLSPGPIETPIFGKIGATEAQQKEFIAGVTSQVPMGRFGRSDEIAKAALFLASDDSSYITGIDLSVDGGMAQV